MIGELNGENTQGLNFLTDQVEGGIIETAYQDKSIAFEIERSARTIKLTGNNNGRLKFNITINCEGFFIKSAKGLDLSDSGDFTAIERQFETEIRRVTNRTIRTLQQRYKKDAIGLEKYLYQNQYRTWKKTSPDWEQGKNLFASADIEVNVHVKIHRIGDINEAEKG